MQVFVSLLLDANVNIRCKAAGALQSLAVHPGNQQVPRVLFHSLLPFRN